MTSSRWLIPLAIAALALPGCGELDTNYGHVRGESVNGTGAFAEVLRARGDEVRTAWRLNDEVSAWADTIVRFAPFPGPPEKEEALWYQSWLSTSPGRRLLYVPRDFEAQSEYWAAVIADAKGASPSYQRRYKREKSRADSWTFELPPPAKEAANADNWFAVEYSGGLIVCQKLAGPWAVGIDAAKAGISRRQTLKVGTETVLLEGDGKPLVLAWTWANGSEVLAVANGSFLLNEPLAHPERRRLAQKVVEWLGEGEGNVAFIEGKHPTGDAETPSLFDVLKLDPINWIAGHIVALGILGGLALAVRFGRARGEAPSGADRPVAHAEALGDLLARTRNADAARAYLDAYRRWRFSPSSSKSRPGAGRL